MMIPNSSNEENITHYLLFLRCLCHPSEFKGVKETGTRKSFLMPDCSPMSTLPQGSAWRYYIPEPKEDNGLAQNGISSYKFMCCCFFISNKFRGTEFLKFIFKLASLCESKVNHLPWRFKGCSHKSRNADSHQKLWAQ